MKSSHIRKALRSGVVLAAWPAMAGAATMDITPGFNNIPISRVVYDVGGSTVTQTSEATGVTQTGNTSVFLKSITGTGPELTYFNISQAKVVNVNPGLATVTDVGVFNNGTNTSSTSGLLAYADAVAGTSMDTDLRNFGFHDLPTPWPLDPNSPDVDLLFAKAMNPSDFLVVSERWGNSSFQLLALAADGDPLIGSNLIRLGGSATDVQVGYTSHDWNTGYAAQTNVPDQAQVLTLFSILKFFEGSGLAEQAVYGVRIFNSDDADVKVLGISDDTFDNNPDNPEVIPEPSSLLITLAGGMALVFSRRRRPAAC